MDSEGEVSNHAPLWSLSISNPAEIHGTALRSKWPRSNCVRVLVFDNYVDRGLAMFDYHVQPLRRPCMVALHGHYLEIGSMQRTPEPEMVSDVLYLCRARRVGVPMLHADRNISREHARRVAGVEETDVLLTVASEALGARTLCDFTRSMTPQLLTAMPNLKVNHSSGILCTVDVPHPSHPTQVSLWPRASSSSKEAAPSKAAANPLPPTSSPAEARQVMDSSAAATLAGGHRELPRSGYLEVPFFDSLPVQLAASDLVVARSGALMCGEILAAAVPSVLLPAKVSEDGHEYFNAVSMDAIGAAIIAPMVRRMGLPGTGPEILEDEEEDEEDVDEEEVERMQAAKRISDTKDLLIELLSDSGRRAKMTACARKHRGQDAAEIVARALVAIAAEPGNEDVAVLRPFVEAGARSNGHEGAMEAPVGAAAS
jgi:hypothetical protein